MRLVILCGLVLIISVNQGGPQRVLAVESLIFADFRKMDFISIRASGPKSLVHIFPHWNWEGIEGKVIPLLAYSNCDAVELFLNGKSYGEKRGISKAG